MKSSAKNEYYLRILSLKDLRSLMAAILFMVMLPWPASAIDISDIPLDAQLNAAAPNFMMGLDDSGSMDWEIMADTNDGLFQLNTSYEYVFDDPSDENLYQTGLNADIITGNNRLYYRSQWSGYNYVYYNPATTYRPWPLSTSPTLVSMPEADINRPRHHPYYSNKNNVYINLNDTYVNLPSSSSISVEVNDNNTSSTSSTGIWASDSTRHWTTNVGATFTWKPNITTAGRYEVQVYNGSYSGNDTNAKYTISYNGGTVDKYISQVGGNNWTSLGSYDFAAGTGGTVTVTRSSSSGGSYTIADRVKFVFENNAIANAHYFVKSTNGKMYLVNLKSTKTYYEIKDNNSNNYIDNNEAGITTDPPADIVTSRTFAEERQNFANWYQYHRKRVYTSIAAICDIIPKLKGVNVGIRSINGHIKKAVVPIQIGGVDKSNELITKMISYRQSDFGGGASTPLREGLDKIGRYYDTRTGTNYGISPSEPEFDGSPLASGAAGACQQNFVMMFSDGSDNGGAAGIGNEDKYEGPPYADNASGTFGDIAMHYYKTDLNPDVANDVPPNGVDNARHQHLVTYTVGFGVKGNLDPDDYVLYPAPGKVVKYPVWPSPVNDDQKKIDDMWHAAVNGRGKYLNAKSPQELLDAFNEIVSDVLARIGSGASVSINGDELTDNSRLYQSSYSTTDWVGDVKAYILSNAGRGSIQWSANEKLNARDWNTGRNIATYTGTDGVPFRYNSITSAQQGLLDANPTKAEQILNYIRGDWTNEVSSKVAGTKTFRDRVVRNDKGEIIRDHNKLGDIVHSAPAFLDNVIYAGANDGMMHAFRADNGEEIFSYVPNHVFENLKYLSSPGYSHKFYVDMTPFVKKIYFKENGTVVRKTLLVGALGKGGKGIYCLDVTNAASIANESQAAETVKWEFPSVPGSDADMGYTFSKPYIVRTAAGWFVIFGNGYNSLNGHAVLYVVDADTGSLVRKIDTGVGNDNGLSTPNIIDDDADGIVDYVHAGDLKGNLWKFNIRNSDTSKWGIAHIDPGSGKSTPMFTAIGPAPDNKIQPITTRPETMMHCQPGLPGNIVVFGTGKYLGVSDINNVEIQTVYGIWDYNDADESAYLGSFKRTGSPTLSNQPPTVSLLQQKEEYFGRVSETNTAIVRVLSANEPVWLTKPGTTPPEPSDESPNHAGWYFDLPQSGERMIQDVLIRDGLALVISSKPNASNPCSAGGESIYHEMNACSGGRLLIPHFDMNNDFKIDSRDLITIKINGQDVQVAPTGLHFSSMVFPPPVVRTAANIGGRVAIKALSSGAGGVATPVSDDEARGIYYWRSYSNN